MRKKIQPQDVVRLNRMPSCLIAATFMAASASPIKDIGRAR